MAAPQPRLRAPHRTLAFRVLAGVVATGALATPALARGTTAEQPEAAGRTVAVADTALAEGRTATVDVPGAPELVAVSWSGSTAAGFEVRGRSATGWTAWMELEGGDDDAPDAGGPEGGSVRSASPGFVGRDLTSVQVRVHEGTPHDVVLHVFDAEPTEADRATADRIGHAADQVVPAGASPAASRAGLLSASDGGLGDLLGLGGGAGANGVPNPPTMVTRAQWGADESWRDDSGGECDGTPDYSDGFQLATVHHTVSSNTYSQAEVPALLRSIYDFHVHQNGWCDIAYTFFVDRFGTIYEGRAGGVTRPVVGGHTSGFNTTSFGVALIGDFTSTAVPPATYEALKEILAFKMGYEGIDPTGSSTVKVGSNTSAKWAEGTMVTLKNLQGHGDSNKTSCPGAMVNQLLPQLRTDVANLISTRGYKAAWGLGRLDDVDRYATAATIAKSSFSSASTAYIARGDVFPDALAASFPAGVAGAPVLLATSAGVPTSTMSALKSLGVGSVKLLGGTASLGSGVEDALRGQGITFERIGGDDRFATAALLAKAPGAAAVGTDDQGRKTAVLASGRTFPDALAAGGVVYAKHFPLLLSEPGGLPDATALALQALGIQHVVITGGAATIGAGVEQQLTGLGLTSERVSGADRYETAVKLADTSIDRYGISPGHIDITSGQNFPDALTGGPHAGRTPSVLLLSEISKVPPSVNGFLQRRAASIGGGHIIGGKSSIDPVVKILAEETLRPNG